VFLPTDIGALPTSSVASPVGHDQPGLKPVGCREPPAGTTRRSTSGTRNSKPPTRSRSNIIPTIIALDTRGLASTITQ
jgi:hypothetical protein